MIDSMTPHESWNQRAGKVVQVVRSFQGELDNRAGGLASPSRRWTAMIGWPRKRGDGVRWAM
jgi:hypothetical protein